MDERGRKRLVGAAVLASLFVIFAPMLLDRPGPSAPAMRTESVPPAPERAFPTDLLDGRVDPPPEVLVGPPAESPDAVALEVPPPPEGPAAAAAAAPGAVTAPPAGADDSGVSPPAEPPGPRAGPAEPARAVAAGVSTSVPPLPAAGSPGTEAGTDTGRVGVSAWAVQLSTFANAANAVALRDALRGRGFTAFVESATVGGKKVTRVYVGPELAQANATAAQRRLERDLGIKGQVVRYPGGAAAAP